MTAGDNGRKVGGETGGRVWFRGRDERGMRGGKNCIRSNHIRERHRVLRNQLNGEEFCRGGRLLRAVGIEERGEREEGIEERKRKKESKEAGEPPSRLLRQEDEAGKDEKTDGERRNLQ